MREDSTFVWAVVTIALVVALALLPVCSSPAETFWESGVVVEAANPQSLPATTTTDPAVRPLAVQPHAHPNTRYQEAPVSSSLGSAPATALSPVGSTAPKRGVLEIDGFRLAKHGEMPRPRSGMESHHGAMSRWMEEHFPGYNPDKAPAVLMPTEAHDLTRGVYNTWRAQMRRQMGGTFDWAKVSEPEIRALSERMFQVTKTPQLIQRGYWQWFDRMKTALQRQRALGGL